MIFLIQWQDCFVEEKAPPQVNGFSILSIRLASLAFHRNKFEFNKTGLTSATLNETFFVMDSI